MFGFLEMPTKSVEKDFPAEPLVSDLFYIPEESKWYEVTKVYWHTSGQHNTQIQLRVVVEEVDD